MNQTIRPLKITGLVKEKGQKALIHSQICGRCVAFPSFLCLGSSPSQVSAGWDYFSWLFDAIANVQLEEENHNKLSCMVIGSGVCSSPESIGVW